MSNYATYEDKLVAAIADSADLHEFTGDVEDGNGKVTKWGNVFALHGYRADGKKRPGKSINETVQNVTAKNSGLALVIFGRGGEPIDGNKLQGSVSHLVELYIDPVRYLKRPNVRNLTELEEAVLRFLHGLIIPPATHCMEGLKVKRWYEVGHDEMYATRIEIEKPFGF